MEPTFGADTGRFIFTVVNGHVTGMAAVDGSKSDALKLPSNAVFTVGTGTITETLTSTKETEVVKYSQVTGTSQYRISQETLTVTTPTTSDGAAGTSGYKITLTNGAVTGLAESATLGGHTSTTAIPIVPAMTFTVSGGAVTETVVHGDVVETIKYVQPVPGGLYAVSVETANFIAQGSATTALSVDEYERAKFTIANNAVTQVQAVSPSGAATTVTVDSHTTSFKVLASGYVEEIHTVAGHSAYEVFYAGSSAAGVYTEVAHGTGTTVDLVGLQAQLAQIPTAVGLLL